MADAQATLFRFQQFVFEFGPFFLATWLGLAILRGLTALASEQRFSIQLPRAFLPTVPLTWLGKALDFLLWQPISTESSRINLNGLLIFSLVASVPALVITSLIDTETVFIRLAMSALYALSLGWFATSVISHKRGNSREQPQVESASRGLGLQSAGLAVHTGGLLYFAQTTWRSFISQVDKAFIPVIIGFLLASALIIYIPAYTIRPWLGEGAWLGPYFAALLAIPSQLVGGAEVPLASALLIKGASLGAALSVMLVAPTTTFLVIRRLYRSMSVRAVALYLVAAWLVAGSLGAAVDGVQRLFTG